MNWPEAVVLIGVFTLIGFMFWVALG